MRSSRRSPPGGWFPEPRMPSPSRGSGTSSLIIYKAVAWRDRDRSDVERLLALHGQSVDLMRIRGVLREFATALDEPERIDQFEALLKRALGRSAPAGAGQ
jgi:hypothetical protein